MSRLNKTEWGPDNSMVIDYTQVSMVDLVNLACSVSGVKFCALSFNVQ